jgi:hypothetical protein
LNVRHKHLYTTNNYFDIISISIVSKHKKKKSKSDRSIISKPEDPYKYGIPSKVTKL